MLITGKIKRLEGFQIKRFWKTKKLSEMTDAEWESLCDRCGLCCRIKVVNEETGAFALTQIACRLLNTRTGLCRYYSSRQKKVKNCIKLKPANIRELFWLPSTCAYRLVDAGFDLPKWHPLKTGDPDSPHKAGFSSRGNLFSEDELQ